MPAARTEPRPCATCSAARAPTSPKWPVSACRCRRASPSRPRCARTIHAATAAAIPPGLEAEVDAALDEVGRSCRRRASATAANPLLVSVRSGARASMPGMMDTILNLGLNDDTVEGLARQSGDRALRLRQLPPLHPDVLRRRPGRRPRPVRGASSSDYKDLGGTTSTPTSTPTTGARWSPRYKEAVVAEHLGKPFPQDTGEQLWGAIGAVFGSWKNARAITYRRLQRHPRRLGHRRQRPGHGVRQSRRHARPPALPSPATPRPARARSTASSSSTPRARTWSPASARRSP